MEICSKIEICSNIERLFKINYFSKSEICSKVNKTLQILVNFELLFTSNFSDFCSKYQFFSFCKFKKSNNLKLKKRSLKYQKKCKIVPIPDWMVYFGPILYFGGVGFKGQTYPTNTQLTFGPNDDINLPERN